MADGCNKQQVPAPHRETAPKTVVFDFGGVVGGTDEAEVARQISAKLGLSYEEALFLLERCRAAKGSGIPAHEFWSIFATESDLILPSQWLKLFEEFKRQAIKVNPDILNLVQRLQARGHRVAMLSNVTAPRAQTIRALGVYDYFDPAVLSCEVGVSKPDPRAFEALLRRLELSPAECLMIDNEMENVLEAKQLGFDTILFENVTSLIQELDKRGIGA